MTEKFTDKFPRSPLHMQWLVSCLRDLTVNVADFIREPVDAVNVYLSSRDHGYEWRIAVRVDNGTDCTLIGIGEDLDAAIAELIKLKEASRVPR